MSYLANRVVEAVERIAAERVANQKYRYEDWSSVESADRYFAVERSLACWPVSAYKVAVSVASTDDGSCGATWRPRCWIVLRLRLECRSRLL